MSRRPFVAIYADESCLGNGRPGENPGGAAGLVEYQRPSGALERRDYWISEPATTNNRMALRSAIEPLRALGEKGKSCDVVFTSDSEYLVKGVRDWLPGWIRRGWRRKGGPIENLELWQMLAELLRPHRWDFRWVRGHAGHPHNEYANLLAIRAARERTSSNGLIESGFQEWVAAQRSAGRLQGEPDPFPLRTSFRPAPALPASAAGRPI